jgi:asparagine synthetase B (glutamine-hydrolysing)
MNYLLKGTVAEPDTAIKNIKMLPAGTYLTWTAGKTKLHRYWNLDFSVQNFSKPKAIEVTRTALEHSIRAHLVSDVPRRNIPKWGYRFISVGRNCQQTE